MASPCINSHFTCNFKVVDIIDNLSSPIWYHEILDYQLRHHVRPQTTIASELDASLSIGREKRSQQNTCMSLRLRTLDIIANTVAQVGIETAEKSRGVDVPLNECHELEEE